MRSPRGRILLDATPVCLETSARGIGRLVSCLLPSTRRALESLGYEVLEGTLDGSPSILPGAPRVEFGASWVLRRMAPWQRQFFLSRRLACKARQSGCRVLLGTETSLFPGPTPGVRTALMMYDLIPLLDAPRYVDTYKRGNQWLWRHRLPERWRAADIVVSNTNEVARTARELLGVCSDSQRVVPLGVDHIASGAPGAHGVDSPFFLYVGAIEERKNIQRLVNAFAHAGLPGYRLVFAGPMAPFRKAMVVGWATAAGIPEKIELLGRVDDGTLQALYRDCTAFLFPSLIEGFGLPPLEAMRSKAPVLAARTSCMPEVLGDDVVWVDGLDIDSIADGIRLLATDATLRARLVEAGPARAALYRWEESGRRLAEVLTT